MHKVPMTVGLAIKKAPAFQFARKKAEAAKEREDDGSEQSPRLDDLLDFSVGDFVGLVMEDSTSLSCGASTRVVHFGGERRWVD